MLIALQKMYADVFTVHYPKPISIGPLCPFSGGSDILIERKAPFTRPDTVSGMVIDTGAGEEEEEEERRRGGGGGGRWRWRWSAITLGRWTRREQNFLRR